MIGIPALLKLVCWVTSNVTTFSIYTIFPAGLFDVNLDSFIWSSCRYKNLFYLFPNPNEPGASGVGVGGGGGGNFGNFKNI